MSVLGLALLAVTWVCYSWSASESAGKHWKLKLAVFAIKDGE